MRLTKIRVSEVSLVDHPANRRNWLLAKQDLNAYLETSEAKQLLGQLATEVSNLKDATELRAMEAELQSLQAQEADAVRAQQRENWRLANDPAYWNSYCAREIRRNLAREDGRVYENQQRHNQGVARPDPKTYKPSSDFGKA